MERCSCAARGSECRSTIYRAIRPARIHVQDACGCGFAVLARQPHPVGDVGRDPQDERFLGGAVEEPDRDHVLLA
jgi:hypothetical protein